MKTLVIVTTIACLATWAPSRATEVHWTPAHHLAPQGMNSAFAVGDLDADSDYDVSMFNSDPVYHYWNVGTPQDPAWQLDTTQFPTVPWCYYRTGALGDLDQDGDLDLVIGCDDELLRCYWNIGTPQGPLWQYDPTEFEGITVFVGPAQPYLADLDNDGDLDLTVTVMGGAIQRIENTGTPSDPDWTYQGHMSGIRIGPGGGESAALGDIDGDGDLDLVGVSWDTPPQCWENVGTPESFEFVENPAMLTGVDESASGRCVGLMDIDADDDLDLLIALGFGENHLYLNEDYVPVGSTTWTAIKAMFR